MKVADITYLHKDMVAIAKVLNAEHPEDAVQDLWVKLLEIEMRDGNIDIMILGDDKRGVNKRFLYKLLSNIVIDEMRRSARRKDLNSNKVPIHDSRIHLIKEATAYLTKEEKDLFETYVYSKVSMRELAEKYGISKSNIHRKLDKIIKKIRKIMGQN